MPTKVGLRIYQMFVCRTRTSKQIAFDTGGIITQLPAFVDAFVSLNSSIREATPEETQRDRRWYFEPRESGTSGNTKGVVQYGISGFESDIVDSTTNTYAFRRKVDHVENIPLFYEFWFPEGFNHAFASFQSFAARSCVELVADKMRADFSKRNSGFSLHFKKLMPTGSGGVYDAAPVKELRLIKRNASSDVADRYLKSSVGKAVDFQIVIHAKRKDFLGKLGDLIGSMKAANGGVIVHDGVTFDEAIAEIEFGGQRRRVGMFSSNSEAGVIDLTDIKRAPDGHPEFEAIKKESNSLLADFQAVVGKLKQT